MNEFRPQRLALSAFRPKGIKPQVIVIFILIWCAYFYFSARKNVIHETRTLLGTAVSIEVQGRQAQQATNVAWKTIEHIDEVAGPYRYTSLYNQLKRGQIHSVSDPDLLKLLDMQKQSTANYDALLRQYALDAALSSVKTYEVSEVLMRADGAVGELKVKRHRFF